MCRFGQDARAARTQNSFGLLTRLTSAQIHPSLGPGHDSLYSSYPIHAVYTLLSLPLPTARSKERSSAGVSQGIAEAMPRGRSSDLVSERKKTVFLKYCKNWRVVRSPNRLTRKPTAISLLPYHFQPDIERSFYDIQVFTMTHYNLPFSMKGGVPRYLHIKMLCLRPYR